MALPELCVRSRHGLQHIGPPGVHVVPAGRGVQLVPQQGAQGLLALGRDGPPPWLADAQQASLPQRLLDVALHRVGDVACGHANVALPARWTGLESLSSCLQSCWTSEQLLGH